MGTQIAPVIDLNPHYLQEVLRILSLYVPDMDVRAFGSRVKWTAKAYSDLDLALMTQRPLSLEQEAQLREAFDESTIPFKVDFVDWAATSKAFQSIISADSVLIRHASPRLLEETWTVMSLEDALDALLDYRGKTPDKTNVGVPLITAKIVKNGRIEPATEFIAAEKYGEWMTRGLPRVGDVLLTTEAPLGEVAQLHTERVALAQRIVALRGKAGLLDNTYLCYLLQTDEMQEQLSARATGTTVLGIKQSELRKIAVRLPSLARQRAAVAVLAPLDDRITLLRETNTTLEAIAQALFKSWFVDFDPVHAKCQGRAPEGMMEATAALFPDSFEESALGPVPKEWKPMRLDSFIEFAYGKALKSDTRRPGSVPVYGSGGITGWHDTALVKEVSVVVGRKGTVGSIYWESRPFFPIDTVFYVKASKPLTYCHQLLMTLGLNDMNTDAAVPGLNRENVYRLQVPDAPSGVVEAFDDVVSALRLSIDRNNDQAQTLSNARDALLPRLISGQILISELQTEIEAA
jgi:type I restriction enzyme S subunit